MDCFGLGPVDFALTARRLQTWGPLLQQFISERRVHQWHNSKRIWGLFFVVGLRVFVFSDVGGNEICGSGDKEEIKWTMA